MLRVEWIGRNLGKLARVVQLGARDMRIEFVLRQDLVQRVRGHLDDVEAQRRDGLRFDAAISRCNGGLLRRGQTGGELDDQ